MMRILLIHQYYLAEGAPGGTRWNEMTSNWQKKGAEITVICASSNYLTGVTTQRKLIHQYTTSEGIQIISCRTSQHHTSIAHRVVSYVLFLFMGIYAGLKFSNGPYHKIITTSPPLSVCLIGITLSFCKKTPLWLEIRDIWPESAIQMGLLKNRLLIHILKSFEHWVYLFSEKIIVLTPAYQHYLINEQKIEASKIVINTNGFDFQIFKNKTFNCGQLRESFQFGNKFVVLYVGAHGIANGLQQLLKVAKELQNEPILFVLIGDGNDKKHLIEYANQYQLHNVRFKDAVSKEKVIEYIHAADIGLSILAPHPIFDTIYSNKTFDYLACDLPVIMAINGISRQLIEENEAGVYVNPQETKEFSQLVLHLSKEKRETLKQWGENGKKLVKEYFNREKLEQELYTLLQNKTSSN